MNFFKNKGEEKIPVPVTSKHFYTRFSEFYHGGRVSCFKVGTGRTPFKVYDLNSAYPYAMKFDHPWEEDFEVLSGVIPKETGRSFIRLETESLGVFAVRNEDTSLDFPDDGVRREFCITGWEYLAAKETGTLGKPKIIESYVFPHKMNFTKYVDHFYGLKETLDKDSKEYLFAKLFLNSLYGKFAANPENYSDYLVVKAGEIGKYESLVYTFEGYIGSKNQLALLSKPLDELRYYNVATAASITGFVRAKLWRAIRHSKNPLYCDTDGLAAGKLNLPISKRIGDWKIEFSGNRYAVAGKKLYAFNDGSKWTGWGEEGKTPKGWKIASKGVRITGPEIFRIAEGETIKYNKPAPSFSLKGGQRFISRDIRRTR